LLAGLVVACLLSLSGGWVGFRGWQARGHLTSAASLARELSEQALAGDTGQAQRTLATLQRQAAEARAATGDPGWWVGARTPYVGDDLAAVREIAIAVDDLGRRAFPALLRLNLATLLPEAGRIDLAALQAAAPTLNSADAAVQEIRGRFDKVPATRLLPQVREAVDQLRGELVRLSTMTSTAHRAAVLLPPLLGASGARTYLLVSQNLAELRSTGGMFGAYALIRADRGRVELVNQGTAGALSHFDRPVLPLDKHMQALYTDLPGIYPADVNLTPHFPTAAALYREMYRRRTGNTVDGVLATDPVVLSYLLQAIGPVTVPAHWTLTAGTAVRSLLSDTYRQLDPFTQDRYFAASALAVFNALVQRSANPRALLESLDRAVAERRILFWSARPAEQDHLVDTRLAGVLPEREQVPTVGVFLNDGSGAKLGYYLTRAAELRVGDCRLDGRRELHLRLTISSTAPRSGLGPSVLGLGMAGDPYTARTLVYVFSPARGTVLRARLDGADAPLGSGVERGRQVGVASVDVAPGRSRVLEVSLLTAAATSAGTAALWLTPGATPWTTQISSAPTCNH
jgi:predicted negative regulator of RcsB-dependent stress response